MLYPSSPKSRRVLSHEKYAMKNHESVVALGDCETTDKFIFSTCVDMNVSCELLTVPLYLHSINLGYIMGVIDLVDNNIQTSPHNLMVHTSSLTGLDRLVRVSYKVTLLNHTCSLLFSNLSSVGWKPVCQVTTLTNPKELAFWWCIWWPRCLNKQCRPCSTPIRKLLIELVWNYGETTPTICWNEGGTFRPWSY